MTYTADFKALRSVGDMFQSINGDVWVVTKTHGLSRFKYPDGVTGVRIEYQRATVERIWKHEDISNPAR